MTVQTRAYILKNDDTGEEALPELLSELTEGFRAYDTGVEARYGVGRVILEVPDTFPAARSRQIIEDLGHAIEHIVPIGPASGRDLIVDLEYQDGGQVVSATLDEGQLVLALRDTDPGAAQALRIAVTALARDNDFPFGASPLDGDLVVRDVLQDRTFWDQSAALKWSPEAWDPEEPRLLVIVVPQAPVRDGGEFMDIHIDGVSAPWEVPLRLIPEGLDIDSAESLEQLAALPCAPERVRAWTGMGGFRVELGNPEILREPEEGPGF